MFFSASVGMSDNSIMLEKKDDLLSAVAHLFIEVLGDGQKEKEKTQD